MKVTIRVLLGCCFVLPLTACGAEPDVEQGDVVTVQQAETRAPGPLDPVIDCAAPGKSSCIECGAGSDGIYCCFVDACNVVNKPKAISKVPLPQSPPLLGR
jgi:hypothetical protein